MGARTKIEWATASWNPLRGCFPASEGCANCYAADMARRFRGPGMPWEGVADAGGWTGALRFVESALGEPARWREPRLVFLGSMSDPFHDLVREEWLDRILQVVDACPRHLFLALTKRPRNIRAKLWGGAYGRFLGGVRVLPNLWLGVSAENQERLRERLAALFAAPAAGYFLSAEPLLGRISLLEADWAGADRAARLLRWVVGGGETGARARPCFLSWARALRDGAKAMGLPFLWKQWGEWAPFPWDGRRSEHPARRILPGDPPELAVRVRRRRSGRVLDGRLWDEFPAWPGAPSRGRIVALQA